MVPFPLRSVTNEATVAPVLVCLTVPVAPLEASTMLTVASSAASVSVRFPLDGDALRGV